MMASLSNSFTHRIAQARYRRSFRLKMATLEDLLEGCPDLRLDVSCWRDDLRAGGFIDTAVFAALVRARAPKSYFEIGTGFGRSAMLAALNTPAEAVIHTMCIDYLDNPRIGWISEIIRLRKRYTRSRATRRRFRSTVGRAESTSCSSMALTISSTWPMTRQWPSGWSPPAAGSSGTTCQWRVPMLRRPFNHATARTKSVPSPGASTPASRSRVRISVIIPSFNQASFLHETLESVFAQPGVEAEMLVFDGGSTDGTVDILRWHTSRLAYWESAPDRGQTHAINKGLARMTGDAWMYLNSDDLVVPGALARAARLFDDPSVTWVSGACEGFGGPLAAGVVPGPAARPKDYLAPWNRPSRYIFPFSGACVMRRCIPERIGLFDESYDYSMDMEYYARAVFNGAFSQTVVPDVLARWRWHAGSKTMRRGIAYAFRADEIRIAETYAHHLSPDERAELEGELRFQRKSLAVREAMWLLEDGQRQQALARLTRAVTETPSLAVFRPWLGAVRRTLAGGGAQAAS